MLLADANTDADRIPTDKVLTCLERSVRASMEGGGDDDYYEQGQLSLSTLESLFNEIRVTFGESEEPEYPAMSIADATGCFLDGLQGLAEEGDAHAAMVCVYKYTDDILESGRFENLRLLIDLADPDSQSPEVLLTLLTVSKLAPEHEIPMRAKFYDAVRNRFNVEFDPTEVARLLDRLQ